MLLHIGSVGKIVAISDYVTGINVVFLKIVYMSLILAGRNSETVS